MIIKNAKISMAWEINGSYGSPIVITDATEFVGANIVHGNIPCTQIKVTEGVFSNEALQRVEIRIKKGTPLDALTKGKMVKLIIDNGAIVRTEEFVLTALVASRANASVSEDVFSVLSLSPATKALDGGVAKVEFALHA